MTEPTNYVGEDFTKYKKFLQNQIDQESKESKIQNQIFAIKIEMEDFINSTDNSDNYPGVFIKKILDILNVNI